MLCNSDLKKTLNIYSEDTSSSLDTVYVKLSQNGAGLMHYIDVIRHHIDYIISQICVHYFWFILVYLPQNECLICFPYTNCTEIISDICGCPYFVPCE